jgi:hypothetical protein
MTTNALNTQSTIFKYKLETTDVQTIYVPIGYKMLCVQLQNGGPTLWIQVEPNNGRETVTLEIKGTGDPMSPVSSRKYVGTYQLSDGALVFHVFEIKPKKETENSSKYEKSFEKIKSNHSLGVLGALVYINKEN